MIREDSSLFKKTFYFFSRFFPKYFDWSLFLSIVPLLLAGLLTMNSFEGSNQFFNRQIVWIVLSLLVLISFSFIDWHFLRNTKVIVGIYLTIIFMLLLLAVVGSIVKGAQSWFHLGIFAFQPSDPSKLVLILVLAKYFSRRHIEIAHIKHIVISGIYALILFVLVFLQPDFGSAIIIFCIWLGMVLVAGISKKHLFLVFSLGILTFFLLWNFAFAPYQKTRILTFIHPLTDIRGAGYNAYQSMIAVGSGEVFGKGIGFGTQSKLQFLPEFQTDFIFAAFAEEWGFFGVTLLLLLFGVVIWRIIDNSQTSESNFESLFCAGLAILFLTHFIVHVGINIGLLPVTGTTIPFLSYGGSHLITEMAGLGILMGMRRYARAIHGEDLRKEIVGI